MACREGGPIFFKGVACVRWIMFQWMATVLRSMWTTEMSSQWVSLCNRGLHMNLGGTGEVEVDLMDKYDQDDSCVNVGSSQIIKYI